MTVLSLLGGDWEYQFEDETTDAAANVGTRMLVYLSGVVRTTNEVYSALAAATDEFQAMGFKNPMLPVTPNAYTMENSAFISRASTEHLKEGTISGDWSLEGIAGNNAGRGVLRVAYSGGTNFVAGDVGKLVTQGDTSDTGTLLDFEIEPDGTTVAWIRPDDATLVTGDLFDGTGTLVVTAGTGSTTSSVAGTAGSSQYTAVQAIGSVPTATEVYIIQDRIKLKDAATDTFQFWSTDTTVSLGIISVLIRTENSGVTIAAGDLEVFARKYGAQYDNFRLNVAAGGFSALPLASSPDINNTTGYRQVTGSTGSGTFEVGEIVDEAVSGAQIVLTAVGGTVPAPILEYYIVGNVDIDVFSSGAQTLTGATSGATATSAAPIANPGGPTDATSGEGGTVTITIGHTTRDHDNSGVAEPYSVIVDAQSNVPIAKVYERIKYVTRRGSDNTFWNSVATSVDGEQYRGLEILAYYDNPIGTFTQGDDVSGAGTYTSRVFAVNSTAAGEDVNQAYVTMTDQQTSVSTIANNDTLSDEAADTVDVDTAGAGGDLVALSSPKTSPFGTFTGTQIFGAPGIDFRNPGSGDAQAYILTDDLGTLRSPPNTITYTIANTRAGDRCLAARDTGTSGVIDKDQFGGMTITSASATSITVGGSIDSEVPASGYIRVVETTLEQEHKYLYASRTTGASGVFTLVPITPGTATAGTSPTVLEDTGSLFQTEGVEVGMLVQDTTNGDTYEVTAVVDEDTLNIQQVFGTGGTFASGDTYTINETIQAYTTSDDIFDLILDAEEDTGTDGSPGSISNTLVKTPAANFGTVAQVRQGKVILPFEQNQVQGDGDTTVTTVRTPDTIAV